MIRPLAVLLALAVLLVTGALLLPGGSAGPQLRAISAEEVREPVAIPPGNIAPVRPPATSRTARRTPPKAPAAADADFDLTLDEISPTIPRRGPVRLRGTVTNRTDEAWRDLNIHPFTSYSAMTTAREIEVASESDPEMYVGERIIEAGAFDDSISSLEPGQTASWSIRVPRDTLLISELPGVYWIGAHVLGANSEGRDGNAHGRVRTLIPLLPDDAEPVSTQLAVPVRRVVQRDARGRLTDVDGWADDLATGGRLANLTAFVRSARRATVTWVIDPAVVDAVKQLAAGNPESTLEPTKDADGPTDEDADEEEGATEILPVQSAAATWLAELTSLAQRHPVLALPYGDLDVVAAARHNPGLYARARTLSTNRFEELGIDAAPAVVPPSGVLAPEALDPVPGDTEIFLSPEALPGDQDEGPDSAPATITSQGDRISIHDAAAATGGPGPDERLGRVALRQRVLAEAAVRSLAGGEDPLQVFLPHRFDPGTGDRAFFDGLDQPFVDLGTASVDRQGPAPDVDEIAYPARQAARELSVGHLVTSQQIIDSGSVLDNILPGTDVVAEQAVRQALALASYQVRDDPVGAQVAGRNIAARLSSKLDAITIDAPSFVILSAESGPFAVTITNDLDQPVEIKVQAETRDDLVIRAPETIELGAEAQQTVQLDAQARSIGVHSVRLVATDSKGTPIGTSDEVSVRSNTVGNVIWVVLGVGVGILFAAIPVRWVRRWRRARAA